MIKIWLGLFCLGASLLIVLGIGEERPRKHDIEINLKVTDITKKAQPTVVIPAQVFYYEEDLDIAKFERDDYLESKMMKDLHDKINKFFYNLTYHTRNDMAESAYWLGYTIEKYLKSFKSERDPKFNRDLANVLRQILKSSPEKSIVRVAGWQQYVRGIGKKRMSFPEGTGMEVSTFLSEYEIFCSMVMQVVEKNPAGAYIDWSKLVIGDERFVDLASNFVYYLKEMGFKKAIDMLEPLVDIYEGKIEAEKIWPK